MRHVVERRQINVSTTYSVSNLCFDSILDEWGNTIMFKFVVVAEMDYEYLVEYKVRAYSLRDALQRLNLDLKQVREWSIKEEMEV